ncbi:MAG: sigma-54-dependent Fis family transcriptional regulator [Amylibacter sp.]|nr:sigma-54-dependent Fis family transcriptional regulator [Amylibacter sp.]
MAKFHVLVIDDDKEMRQSLVHLLSRTGWQVSELPSAEGAEQKIGELQPDVILSDVRMPRRTGLDLLQSLQGQNAPPMVMISAHGDIPMAVEAIQDGAYSFLEKPFDPRRLLGILEHAAKQHRLQKNTDRLRERLSAQAGLNRVLLGDTEVVKRLRDDIVDFAGLETNVMILGATGTGKELVANALHNLSARSDKSFVAINCAVLNPAGFDAIFAKANGGTLFLDEFTAALAEVQAMLLRVVETQVMTLAATGEQVRLDIRFISATNENIEGALDQGMLRKDLYHRLNTLILELPALQDRKDDIALLFEHFIGRHAEVYEINPPQQTAADISALLSHDWAGNVRELRNVAERCVLAARRGGGSVVDALRISDDSDDMPENLRGAMAAFEKQLIGRALQAHRGRMDDTAEALGIGRRTLNEKIVKLGLDKGKLL